LLISASYSALLIFFLVLFLVNSWRFFQNVWSHCSRGSFKVHCLG
jgi:hypothetical protein